MMKRFDMTILNTAILNMRTLNTKVLKKFSPITLLSATVLSAMFISACQPSNEPNQKTANDAKTNELKNTAQAKQVDKACLSLSTSMQAINHESKVESLEKVNQLLKDCVSQVDNAQQLKWIDETTSMYDHFFAHELTDSKQMAAFDEYGLSILEANQGDALDQTVIKGDQKIFKTLSPRDQYLMNQQDKAYIELHYQGEGMFQYRRSPAYIKTIFAEALPEDQRVFVTRMAQDNDALFFNDAAIAISWAEMVDRALFWENYLQKYPKSHFKADAKKLFEEYQYFIFFGSDNTPVSDEFAPDTWIDENAFGHIKALAKRQDTALAEPAKKFLTFIKTPVNERMKKYPVEPKDRDGYEKSSYTIAREQLRKVLNLSDPWDSSSDSYRDCHADGICVMWQQ